MSRRTDDSSELIAFRGDRRILYRLVPSSVTTEDDWRSNYERGDPPRKAEIASALNHFALSMWDQEHVGVLYDLSQRWPQLGRFVAEVEMNGELGIWYAETGPEGHFSVWGRPSDLQRSVNLPTYAV